MVPHPGRPPARPGDRRGARPRHGRRPRAARRGGRLLRPQRRGRRRLRRRPRGPGPARAARAGAVEPPGRAVLGAVLLRHGRRRRGDPGRRRPPDVLGLRRLQPGSHRAAGLRGGTGAARRHDPRASPRLPRAGRPARAAGAGSTRNALPGYDLPRRRITGHRLLRTPLRTSAMRSLGAYLNVFAIESFLDESAAAAGADPLAFRLAHLSDARGRRVLRLATDAAGWGRVAARRARPRSGLRALQEPWRLVRRRRRGRGHGRRAGPPAVGRRGRRRRRQPRRGPQPDRGRRGAVDELDARRTGAVRPPQGHQRGLGELPDPAVLRRAPGGRADRPRRHEPERRCGRGRTGSHRGSDRQRARGRDRRAGCATSR